jgi:hypothetical protein
MILADQLQAARGNLRRTPQLAPKSITVQERSAEIRAVTGVKNDDDRVRYYLNGGVDAWFDELDFNLQREGKLGIGDVTFVTSLVSLSRQEKEAIHDWFKEAFGDVVSVEDSSESALKAMEQAGGYFKILERKVEEMRARIENDGCNLRALCDRLDSSIQENHGGSAFVKLTTRSPKDSYWAFCRARDGRTESERKSEDGRTDDNTLWTNFAEALRQKQCLNNGKDAVLLLTTSRRVFEDLATDLFENPSGVDQVQLTVRTFDASVTPQTEFRGFVWNKRFVCCGQYFHQLHFPELSMNDELVARISEDLRRFYEEELAPNIPDFLQRCPCFMMDLMWTEDRVLLTEINPFDGEAVGVFPASTGLFSWDDPDDRRLMMGESNFEMRIRKEALLTTENLRKHPDLRNLSPLWKEAIYG